MKYRKKPVVIEAIKFKEDNIEEIKKFCNNIKITYSEYNWLNDKEPKELLLDVVIETLKGDMRVMEGDYIIKGVNGEFYPCKPDIFEKTYELAE